MTALRAQFARLHIIAGLFALASTLGVIVAMSSTNGYLQTAMQQHDSHLEAISERTERIQTLSRHIRKASLTSPEALELPFAGFIGRAGQIEPGTSLRIGSDGNISGGMLEVVSAHKINPTIALPMPATEAIALMLVTARTTDAPDGALVRFLVAVTPEKPASRPVVRFDHRTL